MKRPSIPNVPKWLNAQNLIVACAVLALTAVLVVLFIVQQGRIDAGVGQVAAQHSRIDELSKQNSYLTEQYTKVYGQAKSEGVEPTTAPPSTLPEVAPQAGSAGKDGRGVAFSLCTALGWEVTYSDGKTENAGTCVGDDGADGKAGAAGKTGKPGETGAEGVPGGPGIAGAPGDAGPAGPPGANGVDGKDGAPGAPGADGRDGQDGRGVASVSCVDGPAFRFTYTDGTTEDVPGACAAPVPTIDPTPAD